MNVDSTIKRQAGFFLWQCVVERWRPLDLVKCEASSSDTHGNQDLIDGLHQHMFYVMCRVVFDSMHGTRWRVRSAQHSSRFKLRLFNN